MYKVFDSVGKLVRSFSTFKEAITFKYVFGNSGWYINKQTKQTMKKMIMLTVAAMMYAGAYSQNVTRNGNTFQVSKATRDTMVTNYKYQDSKNTVYPIIINKQNGHCYIMRKSKKTGKYYRTYFTGKNKEYISINICKELNIKYIPTKK